MKALALDTSVSCITIAAKNDGKIASLVLDVGMRQSEKLLPAIDSVLTQAELNAADLDYTVLCEGPGSFTGLRLGFAALKAIELYGGTNEKNEKRGKDIATCGADDSLQGKNDCISRIPIYGINSLDYFASPFMDLPIPVVAVIDAHKDKFYAKAFLNKKEILRTLKFVLFSIHFILFHNIWQFPNNSTFVELPHYFFNILFCIPVYFFHLYSL